MALVFPFWPVYTCHLKIFLRTNLDKFEAMQYSGIIDLILKFGQNLNRSKLAGYQNMKFSVKERETDREDETELFTFAVR